MQKTTGYLWTQALYTRPINNHNVSYNYPPKLAQDHKNNTFLHDWISLIPPPLEFFKSYRRIFVLWVVFPSSGQDEYTKIFRAAIKPGKFEIATMDTNNDVLTTKRFFSRIQLFPYHMATFFWNLQSLVLFPAENAAIFIMFRWTDNPTLSIFYVH